MILNILILTIFVLLILYTFYLLNKPNIEHYCKVPKIGSLGDFNDRRVDLTYKPQSNIITSSCDEYWKDWPLEWNNDLVHDDAIVVKSDQLSLPQERLFGNNMYNVGFIDFKKLEPILSDKLDYDIFDKSNDLLIDPLTKKSVKYDYNVNYTHILLNKKTWINRWYNYDPSVKTNFDYHDIDSPIEDINKLNLAFKQRLDERQKNVLTDNELILYGLLLFDIFKYRIINIKYLDSDINKPVYIIQISMFRESDIYLNTFSYVGFFKDDLTIIITEVKYIGRNSTDNVLLAQFYDKNEIKQEIINQNFSNINPIDKNPDSIAHQVRQHQEDFKLKNQYACFNINYDLNFNSTVVLPFYSRQLCESSVDVYGRTKDVGVYDTPCKTDTDCPFYKINQNYENNFGKCLDNGQCELPSNMLPIGFRFFKNDTVHKPLCYNCKSDKFNVFTDLDNCCEDQYDKKKYPFLKSPDFSFDNDYEYRKNVFNKKYCHTKPNSLNIICDDIVI